MDKQSLQLDFISSLPFNFLLHGIYGVTLENFNSLAPTQAIEVSYKIILCSSRSSYFKKDSRLPVIVV
jgi:hypothetical protein